MKEVDKTEQTEVFYNLCLGGTMDINISLIKPSQPNDYLPSLSTGPVGACCDRGNILIVDGNHRFWYFVDNLKEDDGKISVRKVENPYRA